MLNARVRNGGVIGWMAGGGAAPHGYVVSGGGPSPGDGFVASPVVVEEHVDHIFEEVGLVGGEEATFDLVNSLLQLGEPVVVLLGIVPGGAGLG